MMKTDFKKNDKKMKKKKKKSRKIVIFIFLRLFFAPLEAKMMKNA